MAAIGFFAACSAPVAYTRAVNAAFDRSRGLALGFTQVGIGVAAMVDSARPRRRRRRARLAEPATSLLALIAALGVIPALALPGARGACRQTACAATGQMRSPLFVLLLLAFGAMALSFAGLLTHFVPMLREAGLDARTAGAIAGLIGASVIVSRVVVGWLADRLEAPRIAAACCALCALGCLALAWQGASVRLDRRDRARHRDGRGGGPDRLSHRALFRHGQLRPALRGPVCQLHADGRARARCGSARWPTATGGYARRCS